MSIIANPFNHAGLRDLLMIEWGELTAFVAINCHLASTSRIYYLFSGALLPAFVTVQSKTACAT